MGPDTKIALFMLGISQLLLGVPPLRYGWKKKNKNKQTSCREIIILQQCIKKWLIWIDTAVSVSKCKVMLTTRDAPVEHFWNYIKNSKLKVDFIDNSLLKKSFKTFTSQHK